MSNEEPTGQQAGAGEERRKIQVRDRGVATTYSNFFTVTAGQDAILMNFGSQFGAPDMVQIEDKVVLSPRNAKRLAISVGQIIRRYEEQYGEIDISPPAQPPAAPGQQSSQRAEP